MAKLDIVVAVRNEEDALPVFVERVRSLAIPEGIELGFVFVEDGSTDRTVEVLRELSARDPSVRYRCLTRGYGQAPAIALGIRESNADAIIMMDVDGGHPIELIPSMVEAYVRGANVAQAVRTTIENRRAYRSIGTKIFNYLYKVATGIDTKTQNVFYRLISKDVAQELLRDNRWKHFLRLRYGSLEKGEVAYFYFNAGERTLGVSKYNLIRLVFFAIDGVFSSISVPRFCVGVSAVLAASIALLAYGMPVCAALGFLLCLLSAIKFRRMYGDDIFALLEIRESSAH